MLSGLLGKYLEKSLTWWSTSSATRICDDVDSAKLVTFSARFDGTRSVTLDGDVYDLSGALSREFAPSGNILIKVQYAKLQSRILEYLDCQNASKDAEVKWRSWRRELKIKDHQVRLLEAMLRGCAF